MVTKTKSLLGATLEDTELGVVTAMASAGLNLVVKIKNDNKNSKNLTVTITAGTNPITIGYLTTGSSFFPGYISDLRFTKGTANYITNFVPPINTCDVAPCAVNAVVPDAV